MALYTAQYRYPGKDRLDITVKGKDSMGKIYAPTWDMVMDWKNKKISDQRYSELYYGRLLELWPKYSKEMLQLVNRIKGINGSEEDITLVCFCPKDTFCHRYLLVKFFQHNWGITYGGERKF